MNKLTEQNLLKKSEFLKYSLLASISVGAIVAIPFEGMAMSREAFRINLSNRLLNNLSQLNGKKDTTNIPQQIGIGTVIVPEPEINIYTPSEMREMEISSRPKSSNPLKDVPVEGHYKEIARSKYDVGRARKVRPPTRKVRPPTGRETFVGSEKTEQRQNTYTPEPTEQTFQEPEIIITVSSPTVGLAPSISVTAPNMPNTTLTSPEHYTTAPGASSTPAPLYRHTTNSKPNDSVGANTPPNTNSKVARRLSFGSGLQQIGELSKSHVPPRLITPVPLPIGKSSTEVAAGMVSNISRVNATGVKLAEVESTIKNTQSKIKERDKGLTSKNDEADRLSKEIGIAVNTVVLTQPQVKAPVTEIPQARSFLNQHQQLNVLTQQQKVNAARQVVVDKKREGANEVKRNSAAYRDLMSEKDRAQLAQNQRYIATEKAKKQQKVEDKQRAKREQKRKEKNHRKEKARDIVGIREDIAGKMQSAIIGYSEILPKKLKESETRVGNIEDKKKKQEAEYRALSDQKYNQNPNTNSDNGPELTELATKHIDLEQPQSQLQLVEQDIEPTYFNGRGYSSENKPLLPYSSSVGEVANQSLESPKPSVSLSFGGLKGLLGDAVSSLSHPPSMSRLEDLSNSSFVVPKLEKLKSQYEQTTTGMETIEAQYSLLRHQCEDDPRLKELSLKHLELQQKQSRLEQDIKAIDPLFQAARYSDTGGSEPPRSHSVGDSKGLLGSVESNLPRSPSVSGLEDLNNSKNNRIQDVEELDEKMLLATNARLQEYDEKISSLLLGGQCTGEEAEDILAQSLLQEMLVSDGKSESILPAGDEEQEDTEVNRQLSSLPALASSNECALALSDDREKECLALGDGSEDEESYDSGFEEEEETIGQLSDSDGGNLKITEVDTAIPLEQEAKKEMQTQISENAPTLNQAKVVNTIVNNMIRNRLDASMNMSNNMVAVGAGDEEESHIKRGLWMRGMYGTNNHGRVENMTGYRGTNKGATIGFDAEIDNNIVGIAYSNVHSVFKFKNSKNNDKELINSHVVSIYGQKELPKNFALQALVSASKNFIKDKTTYSYGDTKIRSNVKHRNNSYNAEALLHYNYLLQSKFVITPNIGLRYGKSRDGVYNEIGVNVQEIALTMKENNILSGIVGTKVTVPLKDALKFNNLSLAFQGAVEHNFKEKTQRINRVVKIFDNTFKHNYLIPKQPKTSYNLGTGIIGSIKNTTISLDYNYYLNKHYRSHQGSVKLKVNL